MKADHKLLLAVCTLIGLVVWLLIMSINRDQEVLRLVETVEALKNKVPDDKPQVVDGKTPILGVDYFNGRDGNPAQPGRSGTDGKDGRDGINGQSTQGLRGNQGLSAYQLAVQNHGFIGSEAEWLESLKVKGDKGEPAAQLLIDCVDKRLVTKYAGDDFWQRTNIKCEADHE